MKKGTQLFALFFSMLKIGLFTFGGGYAMIVLLEHEFVTDRQWLDRDEFLNMTAIAESTPGPIAINAATYIGYRTAAIPGSLIATGAVCLPSFVIILLISLFLDEFLALRWVSYGFRGVQVCVVYLILSAGVRLWKGLEKKVLSVLILFAVLICMVLFSLFAVRFSTIFYILIAGMVGVAGYLIGKLRKGAAK